MVSFDVFRRAGKRALGGGIPGAIAMVLQVVLLMWLRTTINYQYRNGGTISEAFAVLYAAGGIARFYQGVGYALLQGPLSRFGDTAANEGVKALLSESGMPVWLVTIAASQAAAFWRIIITPIDTLKTSLQVNGPDGLSRLQQKVATGGVGVLWGGCFGAYAATFVGHYPWFYVFNFLDARVPKPAANRPLMRLVRNAGIGLCAGIVSDCVSNSIRVLKTVVQTSDTPLTYMQAALLVMEQDGPMGLLLRGLSVKIISNGISSIMFTVLWRYLMERWAAKDKGAGKDKKEDGTKKK